MYLIHILTMELVEGIYISLFLNIFLNIYVYILRKREIEIYTVYYHNRAA